MGNLTLNNTYIFSRLRNADDTGTTTKMDEWESVLTRDLECTSKVWRSDTGINRSRPFTRSQARELQSLQAMFMKIEVCEYVVHLPKGMYMLKCEEGPWIHSKATLNTLQRHLKLKGIVVFWCFSFTLQRSTLSLRAIWSLCNNYK